MIGFCFLSVNRLPASRRRGDDASEIEAEHELDHAAAWIVRPRHRNVAISAGGLAEAGADAGRVHLIACAAQQKILVVECVYELGAQLDCLALADRRPFYQREIPADLPGAVEINAIAKPAGCGLRA